MSVTDWSDLMPHTITHKALSSRDAYGKPTYGTGTTYSARVIYKPIHVRGFDGNEVVAKGFVWIGATPGVESEDQITLPDGTTPPLLSVERISDEDGAHHEKVFFG